MNARTFLNRCLIVVALALALAALWFFRNTLLLGFFAVIIAVGVSIPANWFWRHGLPRWLANTVAIILVALALLFLLLWLIPTIANAFVDLLTGLPQGVRAVAESYNAFRERSTYLTTLLPPLNAPELGTLTPEQLRDIVGRVVNTGLPILVSGGSVAATLFTNLVLVLLMAVLFLVDPMSYVKASLYLVPSAHHTRVLELWGELYQTLRTWLSSLFISISITVGLVLVILGLLGMPNVAVVAVFAGFATFVPNLGAYLPLIPIAIFTLSTNPAQFLVMAPVYLAIQLLESNVLTPLVVKRSLALPPGGLLLFQIVAGLVYGLLGVLLAVPLFAVIVTLVRELYSYDALGLRDKDLEVVQERGQALRLGEGESHTKRLLKMPRLKK
jgi:predicted PurR-regulated permease PerM